MRKPRTREADVKMLRDETYWLLTRDHEDGKYYDDQKCKSYRAGLNLLNARVLIRWPHYFLDFPYDKPKELAAWMRKNGFRVVKVRETITEVTSKKAKVTR
jgi:hypothetical protein